VTPRGSFTLADRIRKRSEYQRVYAKGQKISSKSLVLFCLENGLERPRLGMTVTRRTGGAVQRNRTKRLLREWFRVNRGDLPDLDFVVNAREGIHRMSQEALARELKDVLRRLAARGNKA
jgi:ribonuclease P protein component